MSVAESGRLEVPQEASCLGCGYALRGLTGQRCPECFRQFDPSDPWTMNVGRPYGPVVGFLLTPVGRPTRLVAVGATIVVFWWTAGLAFGYWAMAGGLALWAAVYVYRLARWIARRAAAVYYRQPLRPSPRYTFFPLILLCGVMIGTRFPLTVMFLVHQSAFEGVAWHYYEQVPYLVPRPAPPRWIGLYAVDRLDVTPNYVLMRMRDSVDIVYSPYGFPSSAMRRRIVVLSLPPWYVSGL